MKGREIENGEERRGEGKMKGRVERLKLEISPSSSFVECHSIIIV